DEAGWIGVVDDVDVVRDSGRECVIVCFFFFFKQKTAYEMLGEKLGLDPLELRLLNSAKEGTRRATGPVFQRVGFVETLQAAKDQERKSVVEGRRVEVEGRMSMSAKIHDKMVTCRETAHTST